MTDEIDQFDAVEALTCTISDEALEGAAGERKGVAPLSFGANSVYIRCCPARDLVADA